MTVSHPTLLRQRNWTRMLAISCLVAMCALPVRGQPAPLQYREVQVPTETLSDLTTNTMPLTRQAFEQLVREANRSDDDRLQSFTSVTVEARLMDDQLVAGSASLIPVKEVSESVERIATRRFLPLDTNLPIMRPRWRRGERETNAIVGIMGGADGKVQGTLAPPGNEALLFDWSLSGTLISNRLTFRLELPAALIHRLVFTLPTEKRLESDVGIVTQEADGRWTVECGGERIIRLTVHNAEEVRFTQLPRLRHVSTYGFTASGIDIHSTLQLDPGGTLPTDRLRVVVDEGLTVTSVAIGAKPLPWTTTRKNAKQIVVITLPPERAGRNDEPFFLHIDAIGQFPIGQLFVLPRLTAQGAQWISESIHAIVSSDISIGNIVCQNGRCANIELTEGTSPGEKFDFVMEQEAADLQLELHRAASQVTVEGGLALEIGENTAQIDVALRFHPKHGELFELDVDIAKAWSETVDLDSVETRFSGSNSPAGNAPIADVSLIEETMKVQLAEPATPDQPITLFFQLQRTLSTTDTPIPLAELIPINARGADRTTWIKLSASADFELVTDQIANRSWQRTTSLPEWLQTRWHGDNILLLNDFTSRQTRLGVTRAVTQPEVRARTVVRIGQTSIQQTTQIRVNPLGRAVDQVQLRFSEVLPSNAVWTMSSGSAGLDVTTQHDERDYQITLTPSRSEPFEFAVSFEQEGTASWQVPLVGATLASAQSGTVDVFVEEGVDLDITERQGLDAVPISYGKASNDTGLPFSSFAYTNAMAAVPQLHVTAVPESDHPGLWAWRCDVRSYYSEDGQPRHRADYYLQNERAVTFAMSLPSGSLLDGVEVDGRRVNPARGKNLLSIVLPKGTKYPCVTVRYEQPRVTLNAIDWLQPPLPICDISVIQQTWHVWLPPEFRVYDAPNDLWWGSRLLSSFIRPANQLERLASFRTLGDRLFTADSKTQYTIDQMVSLLGEESLSRSAAKKSRGSVSDDAIAGAVVDETLAADKTWAARLTAIQTIIARSRPNFRLLIDRPECRRLGLRPTAPLPSSRERQRRQIGMDRLLQAGLGIVARGETIVLTSASELRAAFLNSQRVDELAIEGDISRFAVGRTEHVSTWNESGYHQLWQPSVENLEDGLLRAGWRSHRQELTSQITKVKIYRRDTIIAFCCAIFFLSIALGWRLLQRRAVYWFWLMMGLFVAALLLPQPGATLALSAAWAVVASGMVHVGIRRKLPLRMGTQLSVFSSDATRAAMFLVTLASVPMLTTNLEAQTTDLMTEANTFPVYVPVDAANGSIGDILYVPRDLYAQLRATRAAKTDPKEYVLAIATYKGTWPMRHERTFVLSATLQITTLVADVSIPMPDFGNGRISAVHVDNDNLDWPIGPANAKGQPTLHLPRPGTHRVALRIELDLQVLLDRYAVQLPIPSIPNSTLRLTLPADVRDMEIPTSMGATTIDLGRGVLTSDLGPTTELAINAIQTAPNQTEPRAVEQLISVNLRNRGAIVTTRFRFPDKNTNLRMHVDRRLSPTPDTLARIQWDSANSIATLPAGDPGAISTASFLLAYETPIGRFRVPRLQAIDVPVRARWLAVTTQEQLTILADSQDKSSVPATALEDVWGELPTNTVFSVPTEMPATLQITPSTQPSSWSVESRYYFHDAGAHFRVELQFDSSAPATVQQLVVPAAMQLEQITATRNGDSQRIRWNRLDDRNVSVFFLDQPSGRIQLLLSGYLMKESDNVPIPLVGPNRDQDANVLSVLQTVTLFRTPDVVITPDQLAGVDTTGSQSQEDINTGYLPAGIWIREHANIDESVAEAFSVDVRMAHPTTGARLTTLLERRDRWTVAIIAELTSESTAFDVARFLVPSSLTRTVPEATDEQGQTLHVAAVDGPKPDWSILLISSGSPGSTFRKLELRADIFVPEEQGISLPQVELLGVDVIEHDVILQTRANDLGDVGVGTTLTWAPRGLRETPDPTLGVDFKKFRVLAPNSIDYAATLERVEPTTSTAIIHLLQNTLAWTSDHHFVGYSDFDLQPAKLTACELHLPPNSQLFQVLIDGTRTMARPINSQSPYEKWLLQLGPSPWPQRVRAVYSGTCEVSSGRRVKLQSPRLWHDRQIQVTNEVWTISSASRQTGEGRPVEPDQNVSSNPDQVVFDSYRALLDDAEFLLRERPQEEFNTWVGPWASRILQVEHRIHAAPDDAGLPIPNTRSPSAFDVEGLLSSSLNQARYEPDTWNESQWRSGSQIRCVSSRIAGEPFPAIEIDYPKIHEHGRYWRYLAAFGMVVTSLSFVGRPLTHNVLEWARDFPHIVGIMIGLLVGMLLSPSWVGLLLAGASFASWATARLRHRRLLLPSER